MKARLLAFVIWAAVAASAVFWLLRLWSTSPTAPAHTVVVGGGQAQRGDLTRVLGAPAAAPGPTRQAPSEPALASRFKLLGVAAPRESADGVGLALIAVDGKPARGFRVGAAVDGELILQSVHARGASIGPSGAAPAVSLELPPLPTATMAPRGGAAAVNPAPAAPPPGALPQVPPPAGSFAPVPTAVVPPPQTAAPTGLRPPQQGESEEPQPVAPGALTR